ncbi:hypothetical protein Anapl_18180 [Anas platyrhynchos]|uniref:Uncharacterized protein n=1 Tax=Anas platyrhynchos TaxID=8839 RepID=R0KVM2_ANAPL|nr:hypothetical protein Anapl_18180 [Anas platyrhynchos]
MSGCRLGDLWTLDIGEGRFGEIPVILGHFGSFWGRSGWFGVNQSGFGVLSPTAPHLRQHERLPPGRPLDPRHR